MTVDPTTPKAVWKRMLSNFDRWTIDEGQWAADSNREPVHPKRAERRAVYMSSAGALAHATLWNPRIFPGALREYCAMLEELGVCYDPELDPPHRAPPVATLRAAAARLLKYGLVAGIDKTKTRASTDAVAE
jgi:hypothetical protein